MKYLCMCLIGYVALYVTVWLHEIGYATYGCKEKWFHVTVKPYIFFSTPLPVNLEKAEKLSPRQDIVISYAGVFVNFICTIFSGILIYFCNIKNEYLLLSMWLFMTLHFAELVSYLFIGNIYLVSDMANIAKHKPLLRIPGLFVGSIMTIGYVIVMINIPSSFAVYVIVWNILVIVGMCGGRIAFSMMHK